MVTERYGYDGDELYLQFGEGDTLTHRYLHGPAVDQLLADEVLSLSANNRYRWTRAEHEIGDA